MKLTKKEQAALAMHEIMVREQDKYSERIREQNKIKLMSDEQLKELVKGAAPPKVSNVGGDTDVHD